VININFNREPQENENQFIWRLAFAKDTGVINLTWSELAYYLNKGIYGDDEENYLGDSAYRKRYQMAKAMYDDVFSQMESDEFIRELNRKTRDLTKERMKLQTEKVEYNRWLRQEARDELILEKITNSIKNMSEIKIPKYIKPEQNKKDYLLVFGDEHYGAEFEIKGLKGEILNRYNPKIFEERMLDLLNQTIEIIKKEKISVLHIFSMGDFSDGILRVSQLMKLKYGVVDGTIKYAEFISNWLNELSKYTRIIYQQTAGNHTELRMIGQPKGTFEDENMEKILAEFIKIRLANNPNFEFIENPTGYNFAELAGYNVMGIHGEVKNMENAIKNFSDIYSTPIDYLIAGHLHHNKIEEIGVNKEVLNMGSIIGFDPYSLKLQKTSNASGKLIIFEKDKGKVCEYTMKLN
jgi:UDP-2,3-diacylglucosamine pyrophosphatase LpxH